MSLVFKKSQSSYHIADNIADEFIANGPWFSKLKSSMLPLAITNLFGWSAKFFCQMLEKSKFTIPFHHQTFLIIIASYSI